MEENQKPAKIMVSEEGNMGISGNTEEFHWENRRKSHKTYKK